MTRRRMLQATGASILGMPVAKLLAASGQAAAVKAEHDSILERRRDEPVDMGPKTGSSCAG